MISKMGLRHLIPRRRCCKCNGSTQPMRCCQEGPVVVLCVFSQGWPYLFGYHNSGLAFSLLKQKPHSIRYPELFRAKKTGLCCHCYKRLIYEPECCFINLIKCRTTGPTGIQTSLFRHVQFLQSDHLRSQIVMRRLLWQSTESEKQSVMQIHRSNSPVPYIVFTSADLWFSWPSYSIFWANQPSFDSHSLSLGKLLII